MRLHLGPIPESSEFVPDAAWTPLKEPSPSQLQVIALPIAILTGFLLYLAWYWLGLKREIPVQGEITNAFLPLLLLSIFGIILVHEWLHAICHPRFGLSDASILGFWPKMFLFFAHYEQELARNRFLLILGFPFLVITFVPMLLIPWIPNQHWNWWQFVSIFNGVASCGDLLGILIVFSQVPGVAIVRNQGYRTYWRPLRRDPAI